MIADRFPELKNLNRSEKLALASELVKDAVKSDDLHNLTPTSLGILKKELEAIVANPEAGLPWEEVKKLRRD